MIISLSKQYFDNDSADKLFPVKSNEYALSYSNSYLIGTPLFP